MCGRFSKLLEGVTSLVSLGGHKHEEEPAASSPSEDSQEPVSLPYWVEASHNIYKEDCESPAADESGYSSIAETASCASTSSSSSCSAPASISSSVTEPGRDARRRGRHKEQQTASSEDIEKIEEKISEIFDSMNLGASLIISIANIVSSSRS